MVIGFLFLRPNNIIDPGFDEYYDMGFAKSMPSIYLSKNKGLSIGGERGKDYEGACALFWCGSIITKM